MPNQIIFLGTGGGGYNVIQQTLATGGIYIELDGKNIIIDPGPGYISRAKECGVIPQKIDLILLSHRHIDHSNDVNLAIEALTDRGKKKRGTIIAEKSCVEWDKKEFPVVQKYYQDAIGKIYAAEANQEFNVDGLTITTSPSKHYDTTVGFKISGSKTIGYVADGPYFPGQERYFEGCDVLILNIIIPENAPQNIELREKHMATDDAAKMVAKIKPKLVIMTHFGYNMMREGPSGQAKYLERETKIQTIAAKDGQKILLEEETKEGLEKWTGS